MDQNLTTPKQLRWGSSGAAFARLERQQSEYSDVLSMIITQNRPKFCNRGFTNLCFLFLSIYVMILVSAWLVWLFHPIAGTFLIVILPGIWFITFASVYYRKIIIVIQLVRALGCVALSIFPIYLIRLAFFQVFKLPQFGFCSLCIFEKLLVAFVVNAAMETFLKFFILLVLKDDLIIDPRSFFVLSVTLGTGFSVLRVVYILCTAPDTSHSMAIYYCFDAPLQCLTTVYMGICFADEIFFEYPRAGFGCIIPPILIHGTYLFIVEATILEDDSVANQLFMVLSMCVMFSIILPYTRYKFTKYGEIVLTDIREHIALGLIQHPCPTLCGIRHGTHQFSVTDSPPSNFFTPSRQCIQPTSSARRQGGMSPTFESTDMQFSFENGGSSALLPPTAVISSLGGKGSHNTHILRMGLNTNAQTHPVPITHARSINAGVPAVGPQRSVFGD